MPSDIRPIFSRCRFISRFPRSFRKAGMEFLFVFLSLFWAESLGAQTLIRFHFESDEVGKVPSAWASRDPQNMAKVYSIQEEGGNKFLHADARAIGIQIGVEKKWELKDFPILRWRWRAWIFPEGTDERMKSGNDNVLSVYVVFGGWPIPQAIKYVWSDTLPAGSVLDSPHSSRTKIVVLRSGRALRGEWVAEERDVLADYRKLLGAPHAAPVAGGILLLTDSDSTQTRAVGDYDDIRILPPGSK
jgi:hypothetical protein